MTRGATVPRDPPEDLGHGDSASGRREVPDGTLVALVLGGEQEAFGHLVQRHQEALFRHARDMGLDGDAAADAVQDALVKAYQSLESCRDPDRFGVWVSRIVRNRCLDYLKSAARRGVALHPSLPATRGNPERDEERGMLRRRLNEALSALPDDQREAFLMKHGEGRAYEDMAELVGVSVSAMKMRVHRARESLQSRLRALGFEQNPVTSGGGRSST